MTETRTFAMCVRGYEGSRPETRFTFTAKSYTEAQRKATDWASYHGMTHYVDLMNCDRSDVVVREASGNELNWMTNNEYVS